MSSPSANADIGILAQQPRLNDDGSPTLLEGPEIMTSRRDVYESISTEYGTPHWGNCCYADIADGSTVSPALPSTVGLRISGVGNVPLPILGHQANKIKSMSTTNGGPVFEIDADEIKIQNPQWEASLEKLVETVAYKLGVLPSYLSAELDKLLYVEKGGHIERGSDDEDVLGSLFIQLPSKFKGGEMTVYNANSSFKFPLGAGGDATYSCFFACHFSDCEYAFASLSSGSRVLLRYSLLYNEAGGFPTASQINESVSTLKWSLSGLPPVDRMIVYPLKKEYRVHDLLNTGINGLSRVHRKKAEALKAAGRDWELLIVTAKMVHTHHYRGGCSDNSSIIDIFDEAGICVSNEMKWLKDAVDFESFVNEGMMLGVDNEYECISNWGTCTSCTGGYYEDTKKTYVATFLVSYDPSFDTELKCLGGCEGVAGVCKTIVDTRDYTLLDRLIKVIEAKEKSKFDIQSCQILLQMLTESRLLSLGRVNLVNKIISGLSSSHEPNEALYDTILDAVDKFGHEEFRDAIQKLFGDARRKEGRDVSVFLSRMDFALKLNKRIKDSPSYLEDAIIDLARHGNKNSVSDSGAVVKTIMGMIASHNDTNLLPMIEAILGFLHTVTIGVKSVKFKFLLNRALLLEGLLSSNKFGSLEVPLMDFAADFIEGLEKVYLYTPLTKLKGNDELFVQAILFTMDFGTQSVWNKLGCWAIRTQELFSAFIGAIMNVRGHGLLRDVLNKCLIQYSITAVYTSISDWTVRNNVNDPQILPTPSFHVQKILAIYPNVVRTGDKVKRLPLHYATAASNASFEVVMEVFEAYKDGASICDPVTGLLPFQLAASNGNVEASFSLLLANPNLVFGGSQVSEKKRKRSTGEA